AIKKTITVYERIMKDQTSAFKPNGNSDFFGARDFYALIKHQATLSERSNSQSLEGYLRNFGGFDNASYKEQLQKILVQVLGKTKEEVLRELKKWTPVMCVEKKFNENETWSVPRYEEYYSWQLLLEYNILNYDQVFLFGSYFPQDKYSNITNYNQLNKIIDCMDTGKTVILHNLESIHESLYDMLNQRYQRKSSSILIYYFFEMCIVEWLWELKVKIAMFTKISNALSLFGKGMPTVQRCKFIFFFK
ncbi:hypothetical protein RFI_04471, partial [Reticulomyxa filosa]